MTLVIGQTLGSRARVAFLVLVLAWPWPVFGQGQPDQALKPEELEQLVAPVALYPDPLLAQVLMASTYPLEVVEAARWLRTNPNVQGSQRDEALKKEGWDDSVKSLVSFPQALNMMNDKLDWTQKLGDAFLAQQKDVMDAVQRLRAKAQAEGNLKSTNEQTVSVESVPVQAAPAPPSAQPAPPPAASQQTTVIKIEPANPQVVYVPTYNPTVVYGAWPYPAYPPYYYYPPGYAAATFATAAISFGVGMAVGSALWGGCNWGRGDVDINVNRYNSFSSNVNVENARNKLSARTTNVGGDRSWSHDPEHRRGTQYRDRSTQQRYGKGAQADAQAREAFRGRAEQGRQEINRGGADQFRQGGAGDHGGQTRQGGLGDRGGQHRPDGPGDHGGQARQGGGIGDRGGEGQRAGGGALGDRGATGPGDRGGSGPGDRGREGLGGGGAGGAGAGGAGQHAGGGLADRGRDGGGQRGSFSSGGHGGGGHGGGAFQGMGSGAQAHDFGNRGRASISSAQGGAGGGFHGGGAARGGGGHRGGGGGRRR